jgi:cell wall-associated NlpC family hydrolase
MLVLAEAPIPSALALTVDQSNAVNGILFYAKGGGCRAAGSPSGFATSTGDTGDWATTGTPANVNARSVADTLATNGFSGAMIAGIFGNIMAEGNFGIPDQAQYGGPIKPGTPNGRLSNPANQEAIDAAEAVNGMGKQGGGPFQITPYQGFAPVGSPDWLDLGKQVMFMLQAKVQDRYKNEVFTLSNDPKAYASTWELKVEIHKGEPQPERQASADGAYNSATFTLTDGRTLQQVAGNQATLDTYKGGAAAEPGSPAATVRSCGAGTIAGAPGNMSVAINWAVDIANNDSHGYNSTNRFGPEYDCSGLVSMALREAGITQRTFSSGDAATVLAEIGFTRVMVDTSTSANLQPGDILVVEPYVRQSGKKVGHVELYIGNDQMVGARSDNDGRPGDSSGKEIAVSAYNNHHPELGHPWDSVWRWGQ